MHLALAFLAADPPKDPNGSTSDLVIQLLVALGASGVITAILTAIFSRRKTRAEARKTDSESGGVQAQAAATLTGSALSLIQPMQAQLDRLSKRVTVLEEEQEASRAREAELTEQLADAKAKLARSEAERVEDREWMQLAYSLMTEAGMDIEPPPGTRRPMKPRLTND
jgi:hypothetical protein